MPIPRPIRAAALAGAAFAVAAASSSPRGREADARLFGAANRHRGPGADAFFTGVTEMGSIYASAGAAAALAATGNRRAAAHALGAACGMWTLGQVLKRAVNRPRPYDAGLPDIRQLIARPKGTSWPSSHPAVLTAFTQTAARTLGLGAGARAALGALSGTVALSRVALGVHYPSDVLSGVLFGRAVALVASPDADPGRRGSSGR
jgi:undecaprenyl-diphosphatase